MFQYLDIMFDTFRPYFARRADTGSIEWDKISGHKTSSMTALPSSVLCHETFGSMEEERNGTAEETLSNVSVAEY